MQQACLQQVQSEARKRAVKAAADGGGGGGTGYGDPDMREEALRRAGFQIGDVPARFGNDQGGRGATSDDTAGTAAESEVNERELNNFTEVDDVRGQA